MAVVKIDKLTKVYDRGYAPAADSVSLEIAHGEFMVLLGPSGCGKTTTLRMIAGLESISSGTVSIDGRIVNQVPAKDRDIAMVFQSYALYPHMSVKENLAFGLKRRSVERAEIERRVANVAGILGLAELLGRKPHALSGGQRQRVALGRAIVRDPKVFLFDEPLSNLDAKLRVQMRTEIKALHQRLGTTTIYVTHDQIEAMTMADKIVVLHDGVVEQVGAPLDLYDRPANLFVAGFIGSPAMNVINGHLQGDGFVVDAGLTLPLRNAPADRSGSAAVYGIRPEHFSLDDAGIPVTVEVVEPTGSETQVVAKVAGHTITAVFRERIGARPGEVIRIAAQAQHAHLFDAAAGHRLN